MAAACSLCRRVAASWCTPVPADILTQSFSLRAAVLSGGGGGGGGGGMKTSDNGRPACRMVPTIWSSGQPATSVPSTSCSISPIQHSTALEAVTTGSTPASSVWPDGDHARSSPIGPARSTRTSIAPVGCGRSAVSAREETSKTCERFVGAGPAGLEARCPAFGLDGTGMAGPQMNRPSISACSPPPPPACSIQS